MRLTIRYSINDADPVEVTSTLGNIVAWERRFKRKASDMANAAGVEDVAYLAYEASKTAKVVVPAVFDDFVNRLTLLEVVAEEAANPTPGELGDTP
jgi:hypothetical protein